MNAANAVDNNLLFEIHKGDRNRVVYRQERPFIVESYRPRDSVGFLINEEPETLAENAKHGLGFGELTTLREAWLMDSTAAQQNPRMGCSDADEAPSPPRKISSNRNRCRHRHGVCRHRASRRPKNNVHHSASRREASVRRDEIVAKGDRDRNSRDNAAQLRTRNGVY